MKNIIKKTKQLLFSLSSSVINNKQKVLVTKKLLSVALEKKRILLLVTFISAIYCLSFGQGSTYVGTYIPSSRIEYANKSNFVIEGLEIGNTTSHCIILWNCSNVTIRNCKFGPSLAKLGVYLSGCSNVTVSNCTFENLATAMIASVCTNNIKFEHNDVKNIQGPSKGGDPAWGQMVQFIQVKGPGHSISYNVCENMSGVSAPEDIVNINDGSFGTVDSPIMITNNWIRGGGPSNSGGGICLGDGGGSFSIVENNILVDPGQYGIGVAGGHDHIMRNNKIYARQQAFTNVGITVWNQYAYISATYGVTVSNNEVNYTSQYGYQSSWWIADNVGTIAGMSTNVYNPNLTSTILPTTIFGRAKQVVTEMIPTSTEANYNIYSNPAIGNTIFVLSKTPNNDKIAIYNLNGQKIIEQSTNDTRTEINTNRMASGVYIVKISNNEKIIEVKKIIITKK